MRLNELSFDGICKELGQNHFHMHYDASDALRLVNSDSSFEDVRQSLLKKYGNVEVLVNKNAFWSSQVKIVDEKFNKELEDFCSRKQKWCDKYGCS